MSDLQKPCTEAETADLVQLAGMSARRLAFERDALRVKLGNLWTNYRELEAQLATANTENKQLRLIRRDAIWNCTRCENGLVEVSDAADGSDLHHEPCPCCGWARRQCPAGELRRMAEEAEG